MAGVDKIIQKMKSRPNGIKFNDLAKALEHYGYHIVRVRGSHNHFRKANGDLITIPNHGDPVKTVYVKDVLKRIGSL